jgi:hypothetical protein
MKSLKVLALTISAILPYSTSYANDRIDAENFTAPNASGCTSAYEVPRSLLDTGGSNAPLPPGLEDFDDNLQTFLDDNDISSIDYDKKTYPLLVNPVLGMSLLSDGRLSADIIDIPKIRFAISKNISNGVIQRPVQQTGFTKATEHANDLIQRDSEIITFEYLTLLALNNFLTEKALTTPAVIDTAHPILSADGLVSFKNCNNKEIFSERSVGYALLSVFGLYAQSQDIDPKKLTVKELFALGMGHERTVDLEANPETSLFTQAALLFAHKRGKIDLNNVLTDTQTHKAIKSFDRYYQASVQHTEATTLFAKSLLEPLPTPTGVAKKYLEDKGLDPNKEINYNWGFLQGRIPGFYPLWKYYARADGLTDPTITPNLNPHDWNIYHPLPELKDVFKTEMERYKSSSAYQIYTKALSLLIRAGIGNDPHYSNEMVDLILNDKNAHNIKIAYYGISDQAIMYFDPARGEDAEYGLIVVSAGEKIHFKYFKNLQALKDHLKSSSNEHNFRDLFSQIPNKVWGDSLPKYFHEFAWEDNWTWRWNAAHWERALEFPQLTTGHPLETIIKREMDTYEQKNLEQLHTTHEIWIQSVRQLISFIPFIGQPIDFIWNLANDNAEAGLINVVSIASEFQADVEVAMSFFQKGSSAMRRLLKNAEKLAEMQPSAFKFVKNTFNPFEISVGLPEFDGLVSHPVASDPGAYISYDIAGNQLTSIKYDGDLIEVTPDSTEPYAFYKGAKKDSYIKYVVDPLTGITTRTNRFEYLKVGQTPRIWEHPVAGELTIVRLVNEDRVVALKRVNGVLREVDFATGEIIPDRPIITQARDEGKDYFMTKFQRGGGFDEVKRRRVLKHNIVKKLIDAAEIGSQGFGELKATQIDSIEQILNELLLAGSEQAGISNTLLESILTTAKGFDRAPEGVAFDVANLKQYLDGIKDNPVTRSTVTDIVSWIKQIIEKQRVIFPDGFTDNILNSISKAAPQEVSPGIYQDLKGRFYISNDNENTFLSVDKVTYPKNNTVEYKPNDEYVYVKNNDSGFEVKSSNDHYNPLGSGKKLDTTARRELKLKVIDKLVEIVKNGNAGVITLGPEQLGEMDVLLLQLLDNDTYGVTKPQLEDVLKNAKGFNTPLKHGAIGGSGNFDNFYEYLKHICQGGDCGQAVVEDLVEWVKKFTDEQSKVIAKTISTELKNKILTALKEAEAAGEIAKEAIHNVRAIPTEGKQAVRYLQLETTTVGYREDPDLWNGFRDHLAEKFPEYATRINALDYQTELQIQLARPGIKSTTP